MQSINAKVKYPCDRDYESKKPGAPNYTTLKVDIAGREERVFLDEGTKEYACAKTLVKGQSIRLVVDKGKYKLLLEGEHANAVATVMTSSPAPQEQPKTKEASDEKAKKWADTYAVIFNHLSEKLPVTTPAEVVGSAASTVFIALTRG